MYERIPVYAIQLWTFEMKEILFTNIPEEIQFTTTNRSVEFNDINIINILNLKAKIIFKMTSWSSTFYCVLCILFTDSLFQCQLLRTIFIWKYTYMYLIYIDCLLALHVPDGISHGLSRDFPCGSPERDVPGTFQGLSRDFPGKSRTGRPRDFPLHAGTVV